MKTIFDYNDYKSYFIDLLECESNTLLRKDLALEIGAKPAHVTQVLNGASHFTAEQAFAASQYFKFTLNQTTYLLHLVDMAKAGTKEIREFYQERIRDLKNTHLNDLKAHAVAQELPLTDNEQALFFSRWQFSAVYIFLAIPGNNSFEAISKHFKFETVFIHEIISTLIQLGLIHKDTLIPTQAEFQFPVSPISARQSVNFRLKALDSMTYRNMTDHHSTVVFGISKSDFITAKARIVEVFKELRNINQETRQEILVCMNLDLFEVK
ncbi:hypothetical protein D3C87_1048680 [compost metagenome]